MYLNSSRMVELFLILTVAILGASCDNKDVGNPAVENSTPVAIYWNKGNVPYEISNQFGILIRTFFTLIIIN